MSFSSREILLWEALLTGLLLVVGLMVVANLPELRRYRADPSYVTRRSRAPPSQSPQQSVNSVTPAVTHGAKKSEALFSNLRKVYANR